MTARNPLTTFIRTNRRQETPLSNIHDGYALFNPLNLLIKMTQAAGTDVDFDLLGTGTVPDPTFALGVGQVIATRTASAADNDEALYFPLATSGWNVSMAPSTSVINYWETIVRTPSSLATTMIWAGLKLTGTGVVATDDDQAYFLYDPDISTTTWRCVSSVNGTDTTASSGVTIAASTTYRLGIVIGTDLKARFYINGTLVLTAGTAFDGNEALKAGGGVLARTDGSPAAVSATFGWVRVHRTNY